MLDLESGPLLEELVKEEGEPVPEIGLILSKAIEEGLEPGESLELHKLQETGSVMFNEGYRMSRMSLGGMYRR